MGPPQGLLTDITPPVLHTVIDISAAASIHECCLTVVSVTGTIGGLAACVLTRILQSLG